eukprot:jgi/Hompol1/954/HPOL_002613-RA
MLAMFLIVPNLATIKMMQDSGMPALDEMDDVEELDRQPQQELDLEQEDGEIDSEAEAEADADADADADAEASYEHGGLEAQDRQDNGNYNDNGEEATGNSNDQVWLSVPLSSAGAEDADDNPWDDSLLIQAWDSAVQRFRSSEQAERAGGHNRFKKPYSKDDMANAMMAWYYAGYYSGIAVAKQQAAAAATTATATERAEAEAAQEAEAEQEAEADGEEEAEAEASSN